MWKTPCTVKWKASNTGDSVKGGGRRKKTNSPRENRATKNFSRFFQRDSDDREIARRRARTSHRSTFFSLSLFPFRFLHRTSHKSIRVKVCTVVSKNWIQFSTSSSQRERKFSTLFYLFFFLSLRHFVNEQKCHRIGRKFFVVYRRNRFNFSTNYVTTSFELREYVCSKYMKGAEKRGYGSIFLFDFSYFPNSYWTKFLLDQIPMSMIPQILLIEIHISTWPMV